MKTEDARIGMKVTFGKLVSHECKGIWLFVRDSDKPYLFIRSIMGNGRVVLSVDEHGIVTTTNESPIAILDEYFPTTDEVILLDEEPKQTIVPRELDRELEIIPRELHKRLVALRRTHWGFGHSAHRPPKMIIDDLLLACIENPENIIKYIHEPTVKQIEASIDKDEKSILWIDTSHLEVEEWEVEECEKMTLDEVCKELGRDIEIIDA